ncbi:MAG TPA: potassium/proton antiporter [Kofleriaceae bacterium]|jgi:cell volume regulation protein A|nr:potassium/proton antiporter [Kofleriaceae bacterium]
MVGALDEPTRIAIALIAVGLLAAIAAVLTRISRRGSVPVAFLFLAIGVIAGAVAFGHNDVGDYRMAFRLGTVALIAILFDGGLNTRADAIRRYLAPAITLATVGVLLTAGALAALSVLVGLPWREAVLLGAVVSSTDAAAVFSVLRGSGAHLRQRVGMTIELESGFNDPMAVILTVAMTVITVGGPVDPLHLAWAVPVQLAVGAVAGAAIGVGCRTLLRRLPPAASGLLPIMTISAAVTSYGVATLAWGSGFLAVYVCGLVLGARPLPDHAGLRRVHDFLAWFAQIAMFLTLGLLVLPSQLLGVAGVALALALLLAVVVRPLAVALCLLPFRYPPREIVYIGWVGLRGAVPIVLATFPVVAGVDGASRVFTIVFFVVAVSVLVQGATVPWLTRRLDLEATVPPVPSAAIEIASMRTVEERIACFYIDPRSAVAGAMIADIPLPADAAVMLVVRDVRLLAGRGETQLEPGDHVYVFCRPEDEPMVSLWFGRRADEEA